jgi:amidase
MRVTHGAVPLEGAIAFAPSFDTAGWFARDAALLERVGRVLLADATPARSPRRLVIGTDTLRHAEPAAAAALAPALARVEALLGPAERTDLAPAGLDAWMNDFRAIQAFEIWATHRDWVSGLQPGFGAGIGERFAWASTLTAEAAEAAGARRAQIRRRMDALLAGDAVLAIPTAVGIAPLRGTPTTDLEVWRNRCTAVRLDYRCSQRAATTRCCSNWPGGFMRPDDRVESADPAIAGFRSTFMRSRQ